MTRSAPAGDSLAPLLPEPKRSRLRQGRLRLDSGLVIAILPNRAQPQGIDHALTSARLLQTRLGEDSDLRSSIATCASAEMAASAIHVWLEHGIAEGQPGEAYTLVVETGRVQVRGAGAAGLRYGVETLAQMIAAAPSTKSGARTLRCCAIDDAPDLAMRGVMLDLSRGKVPTAQTLRQIIDLLARLKLNALMLYIEHTFRFRSHPEIGADDSPLDSQTLRELDSYAAERFVDLIPCLQSLGHMEHILKLPRYASLSESEAGWTLCTTDPKSTELLRDLYADFLPNFRSRFFNANCDEPYDIESGRSAARAKQLGPGGLYLEHVHRVQQLAAQHGKRTMIWGDVVHQHPERIQELDSDLLLLDWWYEASFDLDRVRAFRENGIEFAVCPGTSSWNCLFPRVDNSLRNISGWAEAARRHGAVGLFNTDWGDFGHYNLQGNSWLAFAWGAQESWSGSTDARRFDRAFSRVLFGDPSGALARGYRELGAVHDPGFSIFNGSPLQYLFFDDLDTAYFLSQSKPAALRRCTKRLEKVRAQIDDARGCLQREALAHDELLYGADASLFALRKAAATLEVIRWRRKPASLDARQRRALARRLSSLATEQQGLANCLQRLWLARSHRSNLDQTRARIRRSVQSLRRAARQLERGEAPAPPPPHPGFAPRDVLLAVRKSLGD